MIAKFLAKKTNSFVDKLNLIGYSFVTYFLYSEIFHKYIVQFFQQGQATFPIGECNPMSMFQQIVRSCVIAPIWEEIFFRYALIQFAIRINKDLLIPAIAISSVSFGLIHGGVPNIFIQGVMGLCLATVYIKSNFSLWTNIVFHALWNSFCILWVLHAH